MKKEEACPPEEQNKYGHYSHTLNDLLLFSRAFGEKWAKLRDLVTLTHTEDVLKRGPGCTLVLLFGKNDLLRGSERDSFNNLVQPASLASLL